MKGSALSPRAQELLLERAIRPLDQNELTELEQLGAADDTTYDEAATAVVLATTPIVSMPAHVADRILAAAPRPDFTRTLAGVVPAPAKPQAPVIELAAKRADAAPKRRAPVVPWLAAAASLLIAGGAVFYALERRAPEAAAPGADRAALIASAKDVAQLAWTATADPNAHGASGDVVWSSAEQRGFMRFVGLAPNDPSQYQYQLWIFDKDRDEKYPVDGGVFDVTSTGEVIVPIAAKLHVTDATLFAVTIEKPGGVVVSRRERIVVTAARG